MGEHLLVYFVAFLDWDTPADMELSVYMQGEEGGGVVEPVEEQEEEAKSDEESNVSFWGDDDTKLGLLCLMLFSALALLYALAYCYLLKQQNNRIGNKVYSIPIYQQQTTL